MPGCLGLVSKQENLDKTKTNVQREVRRVWIRTRREEHARQLATLSTVATRQALLVCARRIGCNIEHLQKWLPG